MPNATFISQYLTKRTADAHTCGCKGCQYRRGIEALRETTPVAKEPLRVYSAALLAEYDYLDRRQAVPGPRVAFVRLP